MTLSSCTRHELLYTTERLSTRIEDIAQVNATALEFDAIIRTIGGDSLIRTHEATAFHMDLDSAYWSSSVGQRSGRYASSDIIDVRFTSHNRGATDGLLLGSLLGLANGIAIYSAHPGTKDEFGIGLAIFFGGGTLSGVIAGSVIGAIIGSDRLYTFRRLR